MDFSFKRESEREKERAKEREGTNPPLLTLSTLLLFHRKNRRVLYYEYR